MRGTNVTSTFGAALVLATSATAAADENEIAGREVVEAVRMRAHGRFERSVHPGLTAITGAGWEGNALQDRRDEEVAFGFAGLRWDSPGVVDIETGVRLDGTWSDAPAEGGASALLSPRLRAGVALGDDVGLFAGRAEVVRDGRALADATELGVTLIPVDGVEGSVAVFRTRVTDESISRVGTTAAIAVEPAPWLALGMDATVLASGESDAPATFGALEATFLHPDGLHGGARLLALAGRRLPSLAGVLDLEVGFRRGPVAIAMRLDNVLGADEIGGLDFASAWDTPEFGGKLPGVPDATGLSRTLRVGMTLWL